MCHYSQFLSFCVRMHVHVCAGLRLWRSEDNPFTLRQGFFFSHLLASCQLPYECQGVLDLWVPSSYRSADYRHAHTTWVLGIQTQVVKLAQALYSLSHPPLAAHCGQFMWCQRRLRIRFTNASLQALYEQTHTRQPLNSILETKIKI